MVSPLPSCQSLSYFLSSSLTSGHHISVLADAQQGEKKLKLNLKKNNFLELNAKEEHYFLEDFSIILINSCLFW